MASRNGYTITPSYGGNQRQSQPWSRPHQSVQPGDPRRPAAKSSQKNTNDTFLLAMLFIVAPVCGLLGLPFLLFRWAFIALSTFLIVTIWVTKRFMFQGRAFLSGILVVAAVVSLISAVDEKSMANQNMYTPYYAYNGANPAIGGVDPALSAGDQAPAALPTNPIEILPAGGTGDNALEGAQAEDSAIPDANATLAPQRVMSDAEIILNNYMTLWQNEDFEGMVQYTLPSWRNAQRLPPRQLSYQHNNYALNSWEITSESLATAIDSATYSVIVNVTKKSSSRETVYGKYSAIVFNSDGAWYVDPDSMRTMLKYEPAPVQGQYAGSDSNSSQEAAPTPEPTLDPKMKLYYNSDGGKFYHADSQCSTIDPKYYGKIKSFAYADMSKSGYAKLKPCTKCHAPD